MRHKLIRLRTLAPAMPAPGQACNGCGVCCAWAPCPLGMLLSRRRQGRCRALLWSGGQSRYVCGAVSQPRRFLPWLPARWARRLALRWIGAARGCDSSLSSALG